MNANGIIFVLIALMPTANNANTANTQSIKNRRWKNETR